MTITFDSAGGSEVESLTYDSEITFYEVLKLRNNPTKTGYVFAGWYRIENGNERRFPDLYMQFTTNQSLIAWWVEESDTEYKDYVKLLNSNVGQPGVTYVGYTSPTHADFSPASAPVMQYLLWGKTINYIRVMLTNWFNTQSLTISVFPKSALECGATGISPIATRIVTTSKPDIDKAIVLLEFDDLTIHNDEILAIGQNGDNGRYYICNGVNVTNSTRTFNGPLSSLVGRGTKNIRNAVQGTQDNNVCYYLDLNVDLGYKHTGPIEVTGINIPDSLSIYVGESDTIEAEITPSTATDQEVSWSVIEGSSNINISNDGLSCTITAIAKGSAIIRVTSNDGSYTSDCAVTVRGPTTYYHMTGSQVKIQVDSAIRDGSGRKIETKYVRTINGLNPVNGNINVEVPLKTSDLQNDSGYLTQHQSLTNYYNKTEIDGMITNVETLLRGI